jgi:hypothetical protein
MSELLEQQDLVGIAAGEAVRRVDVEGADGGQGDQVAQALQGGADQAGAAVAVVDEQPVVCDEMAVPGGVRRQLAQLAVDGVPLSLLVGRDPGPSLRWVVNGLEFGRSLRCLRDTLLRRVPTSWAVPGGSADGEDRLGC